MDAVLFHLVDGCGKGHCAKISDKFVPDVKQYFMVLLALRFGQPYH